ncbi:hypothetical protein ONZ51_g1149 [Trametes cubensis]|uniref:Fungal-type protein kinase domain-containing protein n=1 Tax=Trametes cubensis TaxID=1111947 RepID=A0AAD7U2P7_9APHY|nr:hypothetical protein ONZ51_g1149 [Trametes cubensis]
MDEHPAICIDIKEFSQEYLRTDAVAPYVPIGLNWRKEIFNEIWSRSSSDTVVEAWERIVIEDGCPLYGKHSVSISSCRKRGELLSGAPYDSREGCALPIFFGCGDDDPFVRYSDVTMDAWDKYRSDIYDFVADIFSHHQRNHLYIIFVFGECFRISRWDYAGVVVSSIVDYIKEPLILSSVLLGLCALQKGDRGFDTTATLVVPESPDYKLMMDMAEYQDTDWKVPDSWPRNAALALPPTFEYVRVLFRESVLAEWPLYKLEVRRGSGSDWPSVQSFLVGKPLVVKSGPFQRGMRGFVAYAIHQKRFFFLKETRRDSAITFRPGDGPDLELLATLGIPNIPTVVTYGDVEDPSWTSRQSRATDQTKRSKPGLDGKGESGLKKFVRSRLVMEEVALPLECVQSGKELVSAIRDCIKTDMEASHALSRYHADICEDHVMIVPRLVLEDKSVKAKLKGFLVDWELSIGLPEIHDEDISARETVFPSGRYGDWRCMSVLRQDDPMHVPGPQDELEAFIHVLISVGIRILLCGPVPARESDCFWHCQDKNMSLESAIYDIYGIRKDGVRICGPVKREMITKGMRPCNFGEYSSPIDKLLSTVLVWFKLYYYRNDSTTRVPNPLDARLFPCAPPFVEEIMESYVGDDDTHVRVSRGRIRYMNHPRPNLYRNQLDNFDLVYEAFNTALATRSVDWTMDSSRKFPPPIPTRPREKRPLPPMDPIEYDGTDLGIEYEMSSDDDGSTFRPFNRGLKKRKLLRPAD